MCICGVFKACFGKSSVKNKKEKEHDKGLEALSKMGIVSKRDKEMLTLESLNNPENAENLREVSRRLSSKLLYALSDMQTHPKNTGLIVPFPPGR